MRYSSRISVLSLLASAVVGAVFPQLAAAFTVPQRVFTFESIKNLGSCKAELTVRAEHRDSTGITLWLSAKGAASTTCNLTINQDVNRFESYSLSGVNFSLANRFKKKVALNSNSLVIPKQFMVTGRVFSIRLTFLKQEGSFISPLISQENKKGMCDPFVRRVRDAEMEVRGCVKDSDCTQQTIPFGCGCHYEKPLKKGAHTERFYTALALAAKTGCSIDEVSSCDCREVSEVICRMGVCDWK